MAELPEESVGRMQFMLTLRRRGITDQNVLRAMDAIPREHFVTPDVFDYAYDDKALPIACGQTISQPYVVAYMTEKLALQPEHRVLEIGTGSGYQAAILSKLAREVVTIERYRTLAETARTRLQVLGLDNVNVIVGDGMQGCPDRAPFDRILVTAASEEVPPALLDQLADGGVLVIPLGAPDAVQHIVRVTKENGAVHREMLIPVRFVPLLPGQAREL